MKLLTEKACNTTPKYDAIFPRNWEILYPPKDASLLEYGNVILKGRRRGTRLAIQEMRARMGDGIIASIERMKAHLNTPNQIKYRKLQQQKATDAMWKCILSFPLE